jgi:hypothetical protein
MHILVSETPQPQHWAVTDLDIILQVSLVAPPESKKRTSGSREREREHGDWQKTMFRPLFAQLVPEGGAHVSIRQRLLGVIALACLTCILISIRE